MNLKLLVTLALVLLPLSLQSQVVRPVQGFETATPPQHRASTQSIWIDGFDSPPMVAYFNHSLHDVAWLRIGGKVLQSYPLIFVVYEDGTAFWSSDQQIGGPPYHYATLPEDVLTNVRGAVDIVKTTPNSGYDYNTSFDSPSHTLVMRKDDLTYRMSSTHPTIEASGQYLATSLGYIEASENCFADIEETQPIHFVQWRDTWHQLVSIHETLSAQPAVTVDALQTDLVFVDHNTGSYEQNGLQEVIADNNEKSTWGTDVATISELRSTIPVLDIEPKGDCWVVTE